MTCTRAYDNLLERTMLRGGIADRDGAERVLGAALEVLGEWLRPDEVELVARDLPPGATRRLSAAGRRGSPSTRELFEHVSARAGVLYGIAVEQTESAFAAMAAFLPVEVLALLRRRLPADWAGLLVESGERPSFVPLRGTVPGHGHTLATGRPGGTHPLSEAGPAAPATDAMTGPWDDHEV
jgi:uncharacterized protein (DUF2267 family)